MDKLGPIILPPMPKPGRNPAESLARMTEWTRQCEQAIRKIGDSLSAAIGEVNTLSSSPSLPTGGTTAQVLAKNSNTNGDAGWFTPHYPPVGGTTGQLLAKNSNTDYDFSWTTNPPALPTGGTTGQALRKNSSTNYDVSFLDVHELPSAGSTGQALLKNSNTNYDASWTTIHQPPAAGTTGQALLKNSNTDYDYSWLTIHQPPAGGATGNILAKNSGTDYDYSWTTAPVGLPTGGTTGQALRKNSSTNYDASFLDVHELPAGGNSRDILFKNSDTSYDAGWESILSSKKSGVAIDLFEDYPAGAISAPGRGVGWAGAGRIVNGSVVTRNLSNSRTHNRLLITPGGQYGRTLSWGGIWNRMFVSVLLRIPAVATFVGDYALGVCSGTSAMWGDGTVTNWMGVGSGSPFNSTGSATWTYTAGVLYHRLQSNLFGHAVKVGNSATGVTGSLTAGTPNIGADEITLMPMTWMVTRNFVATSATTQQPSYTFYKFSNQENFIEVGSWLESIINGPTATSSDFLNLNNGTSSTLGNTSEAPGAFDSVNFYWNNAAGINIEVAGVAVIRKW